ncbi:hypothetical protein KAS56_06845, partial [candidate division WOR-3 bacterium]|nr:hypothetical protein [candidate division WOR-3 bacterium]
SSGENGLLIDPSNNREFAKAIIKLLKDKNLASNLGREGCKTIHKYFSWEAIAEKHMSFYKKFMY